MTTHEERVRESFSRQAFMSTLGAEITTVVPGSVEIRLPFSPSLTQQNGYMHAGAVTAVLDSACGYVALSMTPDDKDVLTVELKVNLLAPAAGEMFVARGQVKKAGRTLTVCTADAFAVSGGKEKLVATMLATIMALPRYQGRGITRDSPACAESTHMLFRGTWSNPQVSKTRETPGHTEETYADVEC